jgi:hypothetical protein
MKWINILSVVASAMLLTACDYRSAIEQGIPGLWSIDETVYISEKPGIFMNAQGTVQYFEDGTGSFAITYTYTTATITTGTMQISVSGTLKWEILDNNLHEKIVDYAMDQGQLLKGRDYLDIRNAITAELSKDNPTVFEIIRLTQDELIVKDLTESTVSRATRLH